MPTYIGWAINIYNGKGFVHSDGIPVSDRGPVFAFLLSCSYWLFGPNKFGTVMVGKLIGVTIILFSYLTGKTMFNRAVGHVFAIIIATLPMFSSYFVAPQIDQALLLFMIIAIYTFYVGIKKNGVIYCLISGCFAGIALLTKQTALILVFVPFIFIINRNIIYNKYVGYSVVYSIPLFIMVVAFYQYKGYVDFTFDSAYGGQFDDIYSGNSVLYDYIFRFVSTFSNFPANAVHYFNMQLSEMSCFRFALLGGVICTIIAFFNKEKVRSLVLLFGLIAFPIYSVNAMKGTRIENLLFVVWVGAFALAVSLLLMKKILMEYLNKRIKFGNFVSIVILLIVMIPFVWEVPFSSYAESWRKLVINGVLTSEVIQKSICMTSIADLNYHEGSDPNSYIWHNIPKGTHLMKSGKNATDLWRYFYLRGEYPLFYPPIVRLNGENLRYKIDSVSTNIDPVYLSYNQKGGVVIVNALFENDLIAYIRKNKIDYVIGYSDALGIIPGNYYEKSPMFEKVYKRGRFAIYKYNGTVDYSARFIPQGVSSSNYEKLSKLMKTEGQMDKLKYWLGIDNVETDKSGSID